MSPPCGLPPLLRVIGLACFIMAMDIRFMSALWHDVGNILKAVMRYNHLDVLANGAAFALELLLLCVLASFALCLRFYSAMSHRFQLPQPQGAFERGILPRRSVQRCRYWAAWGFPW